VILLVLVAAVTGCSRGGGTQIAAQAIPVETPTTVAKPVEYKQVAWASVPNVSVFKTPGDAAPVGNLTNPTW
jgi:hypothetical protein